MYSRNSIFEFSRGFSKRIAAKALSAYIEFFFFFSKRIKKSKKLKVENLPKVGNSYIYIQYLFINIDV